MKHSNKKPKHYMNEIQGYTEKIVGRLRDRSTKWRIKWGEEMFPPMW